jgi:eukaryotic-like serine/threonine-protein kinase
MPLSAGTRLGVYDVIAQIGEGGMGQVYRARDTKLNREVALKILPDAFASDPDRLARFTREAQVLASLNHPNIAHIHGLEESGGVRALVMELVGGEDLAQRLTRGPIPLDEALPIARQIADALEAAHEQGIIHRDLKPANITIRPDGTVKVLDFGLAKAMDPPTSSPRVTQSPTITTPAMTQAGMILGTAAYMSPEQAKGRAADKRSDVWAFGCVLYEILTGRRAFEGEDVSDTIAAVLRGEPDWNALPATVSAAVRTLVQRCLVKDRRQRIADISVAQFLLTDPAALAALPGAPALLLAAPPRPRWKAALPTAATALATAMVVGAGAWGLRSSSLAPAVTRFSFTVPEAEHLSLMVQNVVAISPDGTRLAYAANNRLFLRSFSEFDAHAVPGSESTSQLSNPAFSPDGRSIAFYVVGENVVKRIAVGGGAAVTICSADRPYGMTWDSASGIVLGQGGKGILDCSPNGGTPRQLATVKEGEQAHGPQMLPGGKALLFTIAKTVDGAARWDKAQVVVQTMPSGARKTIINGGTGARYLPTGHLLYALGGIVFAVRFDPVQQVVLSEPVPVVEGVRRSGSSGIATIHLDMSGTGTLLYIPGPAGTTTTERALALADRAGVLTRLAVPPGPYVHVRASRDGGRLAIGSDDGKEAIVWIYEIAGTRTARRLTFGGQNRYPIWSPDGQRLAFQSDREGDLAIFWQRADGTTAAERLTKPDKGTAHVPESWSPDGKTLLFSEAKGSSYSLEALSLPDKRVAPYGAVQSAEPIGSVFSPDGRWIAYSSTLVTGGVASSNRGVYVQPVPATGARYQIPKQELDFHPVWGPRGTELFYVPTASSGQLAVVSVTTQPGVTFGSPVTLPARVTANRISNETRAYDILPDGRFIGVVPVSEPESSGATTEPQIRVVLNWFEELKARVPTK